MRACESIEAIVQICARWPAKKDNHHCNSGRPIDSAIPMAKSPPDLVVRIIAEQSVEIRRASVSDCDLESLQMLVIKPEQR
jgi:hypothetical protein